MKVLVCVHRGMVKRCKMRALREIILAGNCCCPLLLASRGAVCIWRFFDNLAHDGAKWKRGAPHRKCALAGTSTLTSVCAPCENLSPVACVCDGKSRAARRGEPSGTEAELAEQTLQSLELDPQARCTRCVAGALSARLTSHPPTRRFTRPHRPLHAYVCLLRPSTRGGQASRVMASCREPADHRFQRSCPS